MELDVKGIVSAIVSLWIFCSLISIIFYRLRKDNIDWSVIALFPANLIYVMKLFWKSIVRAIKS